MSTLPRSLQALIREAREIKAREDLREANEETDDDAIASADDFLDGLSRGEYSQDLFFDCLADDCEEDADWEGAKAACGQILALPEVTDFNRWKAHNRLGALHAFLGEVQPALEHYRAAAEAAKRQDSNALFRTSLSYEAWLLIWSDRIQEARELAGLGLKTINPEMDFSDGLGAAEMHLILSACDLKEGRLRKTKKSLEEVWQLLDETEACLEDYGMKDAAGVVSARGTWWNLQAEYFRAKGDTDGELRALHESLEKARFFTAPSKFPGPHTDAHVVRILLTIADALQRADRSAEATAYSDEADAIIRRGRLPENVRRPHRALAPPKSKRSFFSWWR